MIGVHPPPYPPRAGGRGGGVGLSAM